MTKIHWKGKHHPLKWVIWILAVLFLFYEYFIRVTPGVITEELMKSFDIQAVMVGVLSAFYLYAYGMMQIPVGALSDRVGARKLLTFACGLCAIGCFLFGFAEGLIPALIGRFLQGLGSSFGFIGLIYASTHWFPQKRWAILIGIGNSIGMLGAVMGQGPLSVAVEIWGWRSTLFALGFVGVALGLLIFLVVRNGPSESSSREKKEHHHVGLWKSLSIVMKSKRTWFVALASGCYYSVLLVFGALWGVSFLQTAYGLSKDTASFATSMVYLGFVFGGPFVGYLSDHLKSRKYMLLLFIILTFASMCPVIYIPNLPIWLVFTLIFITGFFASGQLLTYLFAVELNPVEVKGTSTGFVNTFVFIVGSIMQPLIGKFLDLLWDGKELNEAPIYTTHDYMVSFTWFPILLICAFLLLLFVREKTHLVSLKSKDHKTHLAENILN